jgi:hypothetical protein
VLRGRKIRHQADAVGRSAASGDVSNREKLDAECLLTSTSDSRTRARRGRADRQAADLDTVTSRDTDTVSRRDTEDAPTHLCNATRPPAGSSGSIFTHAPNEPAHPDDNY